MLARIVNRLRILWQGLLTLTGDDAYQRYLQHWHRHHAGEQEQPMSRREFFMAEQQRKWNRPNRCC